MQGGGAYYSANSRPQHVAAAVAYPYLERASADVPIEPPRPIVIGGPRVCRRRQRDGADGTGDRRAATSRLVDADRGRAHRPPAERLRPAVRAAGDAESYTDGRAEVYPRVVGRTLYGPLFPARTLSLVWSGITLHWLSGMPAIAATTVYANLTTGDDRAALEAQSKADWRRVPRVTGTGARRRWRGGDRRRHLRRPTACPAPRPCSASSTTPSRRWSATERCAPRSGPGSSTRRGTARRPSGWLRSTVRWATSSTSSSTASTRRATTRCTRSSSATATPTAFAAAYIAFVRAITEHPFFRSLDADRTAAQHDAIRDEFYRRLQTALAAHPSCAAVWHVMSLRLRRRPG